MCGESAGLVPRSVMQIFDTIINGSVSGVRYYVDCLATEFAFRLRLLNSCLRIIGSQSNRDHFCFWMHVWRVDKVDAASASCTMKLWTTCWSPTTRTSPFARFDVMSALAVAMSVFFWPWSPQTILHYGRIMQPSSNKCIWPSPRPRASTSKALFEYLGECC